MKKTSILAQLYIDKGDVISRTADCGFGLNEELNTLVFSADGFETSANLGFITSITEDINRKNNENSLCKLW